VLPHHWDDRKDKDPRRGGRPDFEARAWALGQVMTAEAALHLLADRARLAGDNAREHPWPEFAEHDCFACHHDLRATTWRQTKERHQARVPGSPTWNDWYFAMTDRALTVLEVDGAAQFARERAALRKQMERQLPIRVDIIRDASAAATTLRQALARRQPWTGKPLPVPALFDLVLTKDRPDAGATWDRAAQYYLSLAALHNAWADQRPSGAGPPADARRLLAELHGRLGFPRGYQSPADYSPAKILRGLP
jgi:hypothetical protein